MMDIRQIDQRFAVAPQLQPEDIAAVAEAGYTTLICNRPDGEDPGQPTFDAIAEAARARGMTVHHIPVSGGAFPSDAIAAFREARQAAEGRVLAYCRSGTRSATLDALANPDALSADVRIEHAAAAGYDLSPLRRALG
ncbi:TIGR01244 family sulfur transferase [Qipengyuania sp.]|uniref:TIGR01244 family sulfur transferase n=1 Tax=Qipengyuania sp. TaxID=2004515 RepID=UPI0035C7EC39